MRHVVIGVGGIGGLIAGVLARSGEEMLLLLREPTLGEYRGRVTISSATFGEFEQSIRAFGELDEEVDVVWVAPKATQLDEALERVPPEIVGSALVVPLLNGVDHVAELRRRYTNVVAASIRTQSERVGPAKIVNPSPFVNVELAAGPETAALAAVLTRAGFACAVRASESTLLWEKLVFLAPLALATTVLNGSVGAVRADPAANSLLERAAREAVVAARAEGAEIDAGALAKAHAALSGEFTTSMQKDFAAGRPLELDAIAGPILRAAKCHGFEAPAVTELVARIG